MTSEVRSLKGATWILLGFLSPCLDICSGGLSCLARRLGYPETDTR